MIDSNLITVAEFQSLAPEVDLTKYDNPTLSGMISTASKVASDYLLFTPLAENITGEQKRAIITTEGDLLIYPQKIPVATVSAISITKGTTSVALTLQNSSSSNKYNVDFTGRNIRYPSYEIAYSGDFMIQSFLDLRGIHFLTTISYRGGYEVSALPTPIKHAVVLIMRELLSTQYNIAGANRISQGGISLEFSSRNQKSKLLSDAERLLAPYRRIG